MVVIWVLIVVSLEQKDALKFYNFQYWAVMGTQFINPGSNRIPPKH